MHAKNTLHKVKMYFWHAYVYAQQLMVQCFISCHAYTYACQTIDVYTYIHGNNHSFYLQTGEEKNDSLFTSVLAQIVNVPEVYNVKHLRRQLVRHMYMTRESLSVSNT